MTNESNQNNHHSLNFDDNNCKITVNDFNGSFDLLVSLIRERKMDIMTINLIDVIKQYVDFVRVHIKLMKIDDLTEYLLLASYLLEQKSKRVLPSMDSQIKVEKDIEKDKLLQKMLIYKQFQKITPELESRMLERSKMYDKEHHDIYGYVTSDENNEPYLPSNLDINNLLKAMQKMYIKIEKKKLPKKEKEKTLPKIEVHEIAIDIVEKEIREFLEKYEYGSIISLDEYIASIPDEKFSRQYFVVAFVAILVLVRYGYILIEQHSNNDIFIIKQDNSEGVYEH